MSGVWVYTGKLGSGKTLMAVQLAGNAIRNGIKVASNVDLHMSTICGPNSKKSYYRLPDKPTKQDIESLGRGCNSLDDEQFGIILLDECAHWLNARNWQDKKNQEMIQYLIYIRKLGWKVIFIIQDISALDKQARKLFAEHVVYCRRTDRINTIGFKLLTFVFFMGQKPKFYVRTTRYGDLPTSPVVDVQWSLNAAEAYTWYDTNQVFSDHYQHGVYSVIPNYLKKRPPKTAGLKKIMGLTKIYLRKHMTTSFLLFLTAAIYALVYVYSVMPLKTQHRKQLEYLTSEIEAIKSGDFVNTELKNLLPEDLSNLKDSDKPLKTVFDGLHITGSMSIDGVFVYMLENDYESLTSNDLERMGYHISPRNECEFVYRKKFVQSQNGVIFCSKQPSI